MKFRLTSMFLSLALTSLAAQQPAGDADTGTAFVFGRVIDGSTSQPLAGVTVTISGAGPGALAAPPRLSGTRALTDGQGHFLFRDLPKGSYTITASKGGFVPGAFRKRFPTGTARPLELGDGERRGDVTIPLWKFGAISGVVVDGDGTPITGVLVRVSRRAIVAGRWQYSAAGNQVATDDRGFYRAGSLMPGQYVVGVVSSVASAPATIQDAFVQAQQAGNIQAFQRTLDPGAGLSSLGGLRRGNLVISAGPSGAAASLATTLTPGSDDETLFVSPSVFYPTAATLGQAEVITIGSGVERSNVDFRLRPVRSLTVSGIVTGPEGPSSGTLLQLLPSDAETLTRETGFETATAISDAAGAFTFVGVTPGTYTIRVIRVPPRPEINAASSFTSIVQVGSSTIFSSTGPSVMPPLPNTPTYWAAVPVPVSDRNVSNVLVTLRTGGRLSGHVEFIGAAEAPPAAAYRQLSFAIDSSDGRSPGSSAAVTSLGRGQINANGELETYQLPAGKYIVRVGGGLPGWTFAGAWLEGRDISATPFEMTGADVGNIVLRFTDTPPELSGTVRAEAGATDVTATVLLFPADRRAWTDYGTTSRRFRSTETAPSGTFTLTGMAEGEYNLVAIRDGLPTEWQDPVYLQKIASVATRVTVSANDRKVQDLRVSVVR